MSDFSVAHGLSPADPETIALLGIAEFARGEDAKAIAHLEDALARAYPYPLGYLWLYFAAKRADKPFGNYVEEGMNETSPEIWPGPLLRAAFGKTSPSAAWNMAQRDNRRSQRRLLQTAFYLGVAEALADERPNARDLLERALGAKNIHDAIEQPIARQILGNLSR